ncbi:unnamed protein product [Fusarium graminearum]|uniref:Zn(2)-C6 fungal-type domain-containing protein n=1 Tax=Gibberella zeae TaxID=5518 RepID=A0A9N8WXC4_GIBZA|nr:unnamed protein product [Fusarium graminearum]CZS79160.1 unnamed protein product [Fusarium graminearum]
MSQPCKDSDAKLRAACDRCHELKIRCTRTGGTESRCDRCEKNDIDCVYRAHRRIGRPKSQKSRCGPNTTARQNDTTTRGRIQQEQQEQMDISPPENRDSINSDFDFSIFEASGAVEWHRSSDVINVSTHQVSSTHPPFISPDCSLSHEGSMSQTGSGSPFSMLNIGTMPVCDLDLSTLHGYGPSTDLVRSINHRSGSENESMEGNAELQSTQSASGSPQEEDQMLEDRLLRHQAKLRCLYSTVDATRNLISTTNDTVSHGAPLDKVLEAIMELVEILQTNANHTPSSSSSNSTTVDGPSEIRNQSRSRQDIANFNDIAILHVSISYAYIVKILAPIILSLEKSSVPVGSTSSSTYNDTTAHPSSASLPSQTGGPTKPRTVSVSLGSFSLASKPALNAQILLGMISRMLDQLHDATQPILMQVRHHHVPTQPVALQEREHHDAAMTREQHVSTGHGPDRHTSPVLSSAQAAVDSIRNEEKELLAKLNKVGNSTSATW